MRIVINPNGTLTEVDDSLNMIPVQKQQIKMPKHGYADLTKQILGDCIKLYNKDPNFFMQDKKQQKDNLPPLSYANLTKGSDMNTLLNHTRQAP